MPRPDASLKLKETAPKKGPSKALIAAVVVVLVLVGGGIAWLSTSPFASHDDAKTPYGAVDGGKGIVAYPGKAASGAPTVDVYEDFQCPYCGQLEENNGAAIEQQAKAGKIKLVYHVMSFLDDNLKNDASKRAANAAFCAADAKRFEAYHDAVFARKPAEEGDGYSDATLKQAASAAGITGKARSTFDSCMSKGTYDDYVSATEKASNDAGVNGTPAVLVDGDKLGQDQVGRLISSRGSFDSVLQSATS